jgi:hypothetical protein
VDVHPSLRKHLIGQLPDERAYIEAVFRHGRGRVCFPQLGASVHPGLPIPIRRLLHEAHR